MAGSNFSSKILVIKDLQRGQKLVNLLAVVAAFRPPAKSRGKDYFCNLELVDESEKEVKCMIFGSESSLPQTCPPGTVVCLRKVEVVEYQGRPQLQCHSRLGYWAVLSERSDGSLSVSFSNDALLTLSEAEKQRGRTLKAWAARTNLIPVLPKSQTGVSSSTSSAPPSSASSIGPSFNGTSTSYSLSVSASVPASVRSAVSKSLPFGGQVCQPKSIRNYAVEIRHISQLAVGMRNVGVCGVVKHYKPPVKSKGRDHYTVVHLVDESSPSVGLTCVIFNPSKDRLPVMGTVGAVALIKGVRIEEHMETGHLQAMAHEHTLVGVFSGDAHDAIPDQVGSWYDLKSLEKKRVEELRLWSTREGPLLLSTILEDVMIGHCFNMICEVVAMAVLEEEKRAVLSVLDGTTTKMPCRELSLAKTKKHWEFDSTPERFFLYRQLTQDVWVSSVKELDAAAGDVVHMINVQCFQKPAVSQSAVSAVEEPVELRITEHQGKIVHLDEDSEEAFKLKESIPTMLSALPAWSYQTGIADDDIVITTIINESAPFATLEEIQEASQQGEYLVDAEVVRVRPGSLDAVCVPLCPSCREEELTVQIEGGRCKNDGTILEYELNFALNLKDESGELEVLVSGQESRKLFSKILTDDNFAATQENKGKVLKAFFALTGGNDPFMALPFDPRYCYTRPKLQYAIKKIFDHCTASVGEHSCEYHMVDTVVDLAPQG